MRMNVDQAFHELVHTHLTCFLESQIFNLYFFFLEEVVFSIQITVTILAFYHLF